MTKTRSTTAHSPEILLEVQQGPVSGELAPHVTVTEEFKSRAGEIADSIGEVVDQFRSRLAKALKRQDDSNWRVGSVEIQFGITVQAETGVVIAKAAAGATFSTKVVIQAPEEHSG